MQSALVLQDKLVLMELLINQKIFEIHDSEEMLLWVLRDELGLSGTKFGCGAGICGACTIHVDGVATRACITPVKAVEGKSVTTIEGIGGKHPVQQAFLEQQVPQCAWCMSGQMMTAVAFLRQNPNPTPEDIEKAMSSNYCRCGCYTRIRVAVAQAAKNGQVG